MRSATVLQFAKDAPPARSKSKIVKLPKTIVENGKRYNRDFRTLEEKKEVHSAAPIESKADIDKLVLHCLNNGQWRDAMLFVLGFNTAFRIGDLLRYRVSDVVGVDGETRLSFTPQEEKTAHFRKVYYNNAIREMMKLYLEKDKSLLPSSFLFYNQSRGARLCKMDDGSEVIEAMSRQSAYKLIRRHIEEIGIKGHYSAHTLRQTFTYQFQDMMLDDKDKIGTFLTIQALQEILGHTRVSSTKHYSKRLEQEFAKVYEEMSLGLGAINTFKSINTLNG